MKQTFYKVWPALDSCINGKHHNAVISPADRDVIYWLRYAEWLSKMWPGELFDEPVS